jgi:hypothetical protein
MQQESAFFDDELRLTEDEYDLLLDCNYDDLDLASLGTTNQFIDSRTMKMISTDITGTAPWCMSSSSARVESLS